MAKDQAAIPTKLGLRGSARSSPVAEGPPKRPFNALQFFREVRAEARKVTWTTWKETWITSVMVGIMVVVASLFFFCIDGAFSYAMNWVLKLGNLGS